MEIQFENFKNQKKKGKTAQEYGNVCAECFNSFINCVFIPYKFKQIVISYTEWNILV